MTRGRARVCPRSDNGNILVVHTVRKVGRLRGVNLSSIQVCRSATDRQHGTEGLSTSTCSTTRACSAGTPTAGRRFVQFVRRQLAGSRPSPKLIILAGKPLMSDAPATDSTMAPSSDGASHCRRSKQRLPGALAVLVHLQLPWLYAQHCVQAVREARMAADQFTFCDPPRGPQAA